MRAQRVSHRYTAISSYYRTQCIPAAGKAFRSKKWLRPVACRDPSRSERPPTYPRFAKKKWNKSNILFNKRRKTASATAITWCSSLIENQWNSRSSGVWSVSPLTSIPLFPVPRKRAFDDLAKDVKDMFRGTFYCSSTFVRRTWRARKCEEHTHTHRKKVNDFDRRCSANATKPKQTKKTYTIRETLQKNTILLVPQNRPYHT